MAQQRQKRNKLHMKAFFQSGYMSPLFLQIYTSLHIYFFYICMFIHTYIKTMESSVLKIIF